jgi:uncharacterized protein
LIHLIVFARLPILGQVKTRIARASSDDFALSLYLKLLDRTLGAATAAAAAMTNVNGESDVRVVWHYEGELDKVAVSLPAFIARSLANSQSLVRQVPSDHLGVRMCAALNSHSGPAILIGSDIPALDDLRLVSAIKALAAHEMIFNPTIDGGYCLVGKGFDHAVPEQVFENVQWSTPAVMTQTRAQLSALGIDWKELEPLADVDDLAAAEQFFERHQDA